MTRSPDEFDDVDRESVGRESVDEQDLLVQRYLDGVLDAGTRAGFEARLGRDPSLRAIVDGFSSVRRAFRVTAAETPPRPSAGFQSRVLARAAITTEVSSPQVDAADVLRWARRALIAAMVIAVLSLLVLSGAMHRADDGRLQASEADVQKAMTDLDARMREAATAPHAEGR